MPQIYLHPAVWSRGYGRALMEAMLERLRGAGFRHATLWVHPDNARARRFYEAAGWVADGAERVEVVWGVPVPEVRYRRAI